MLENLGIYECEPLINKDKTIQVKSIKKENNKIDITKYRGKEFITISNKIVNDYISTIIINSDMEYRIYDGEEDIVIEVLKKER